MPFELTSPVIDQIVAAVEKGEWPREAAKRLGVPPSQTRAWLQAGEDHFDVPDKSVLTPHQRLCVELVGRVWVAESACENEWREAWLGVLEEARTVGSGKTAQWQGYATLLERRFPDRWRKREPEKAKQGQSIEQEFHKMSAEEARKALDG